MRQGYREPMIGWAKRPDIQSSPATLIEEIMRLIAIDVHGRMIGTSQTWFGLLQQFDGGRELSGNHVMSVTEDQYALLRDGKGTMLPLGFVLNEDEHFGPASKLAIAVAEALLPTIESAANGLSDGARAMYRDDLAARIDSRLADVRTAYQDESLARCPIVSHHPVPCLGCLAAALRDFIQIKS